MRHRSCPKIEKSLRSQVRLSNDRSGSTNVADRNVWLTAHGHDFPSTDKIKQRGELKLRLTNK